MSKKTIAVLTSGGDAPGMNAAVRAVVRSALVKDMKVFGIKRGFSGLIAGDIVELDRGSVSEKIQRGGTMLLTARSPEFMTEAGMERAIATIKAYRIDGLVTIGGDGTFRGAKSLFDRGISTVGIPGTIDNDIDCTDYAIGFDTACNIAVEAVDRLRDTAQSHERCSVVEVMGRSAGHIAIHTAVATGAIAAAIPELPFDLDALCEKIVKGRLSGKTHHIIIVAEGYDGGGKSINDMLLERMGVDVRLTVLGHIQRGGAPTVFDRVMASKMGYHAVEVLCEDNVGKVVASKAGEIVDYDIGEALGMKREVDYKLYEICYDLNGITVDR